MMITALYFTAPPRMETDSDGSKREVIDESNVKFEFKEEFARSYYRDEIKAKGLNPDFHVAIANKLRQEKSELLYYGKPSK